MSVVHVIFTLSGPQEPWTVSVTDSFIFSLIIFLNKFIDCKHDNMILVRPWFFVVKFIFPILWSVQPP